MQGIKKSIITLLITLSLIAMIATLAVKGKHEKGTDVATIMTVQSELLLEGKLLEVKEESIVIEKEEKIEIAIKEDEDVSKLEELLNKEVTVKLLRDEESEEEKEETEEKLVLDTIAEKLIMDNLKYQTGTFKQYEINEEEGKVTFTLVEGEEEYTFNFGGFLKVVDVTDTYITSVEDFKNYFETNKDLNLEIAYTVIGERTVFNYKNIKQGLDLRGGVRIVYEADVEGVPTEEDLNSAIEVMRKRLDEKGYTEADVAAQGDKRILVEVPGIEDPEEAVKMLGKTAQLSFKDQEGNEVLTGKDVADASVQIHINNIGNSEKYISLELTKDGADKFAKATEENIGKKIYIYMDESVVSAPTVSSKIIGGNAMITNPESSEFQNEGEAEEVANLIRSGSIPFTLKTLQVNGIGAKLGADAIATSVKAGMIGLSLVFVFMLVVYRLPGFTACIALISYLASLIVVISGQEITLTLPGIAGIILSIGMAVDANVIIFTRIKEEINLGKTTLAAIESGFKKAFSAIVDGNMTTLIAAVVLWNLGTGPIKGFALTLGIGILLSMFTALVVTKVILRSIAEIGIRNPKLYGAKGAIK